MRASLRERFESKFTPEPNTGCWLWAASVFKGGYGRLRTSEHEIAYAHRVSWALHHGPVPAGSHVLHRCDNPPCVNPDHLFLGTHEDNMADMAAKGRHFSKARPERVARGDRHWARAHPERAAHGERHGSRTRPDRVARGERQGSAKLADMSVALIRAAWRSGVVQQRALAAAFGVSRQTVSDAVNYRRWNHVPDDFGCPAKE